VNAERFITPELKEFESKVLRAQEERNARRRAVPRLAGAAEAAPPGIYAAAESVAELDALLCFAELAATGGYGRPEGARGLDLVIENGRHPVVERIIGRHAFVPTTAASPRRGPPGDRHGSEHGGEVHLHPAGGPDRPARPRGFLRPADRAEIGVVDRIFNAHRRLDDLSRGESTFMVEMRRPRGSSRASRPGPWWSWTRWAGGRAPTTALSIAWAVAEHLHDAPAKPKVLFATHFHELTDIVSTSANARNYHVAVREWQGEIVFLRRIDEGSASKSYGIQVARLAGLPDSVIERARDI